MASWQETLTQFGAVGHLCGCIQAAEEININNLPRATQWARIVMRWEDNSPMDKATLLYRIRELTCNHYSDLE